MGGSTFGAYPPKQLWYVEKNSGFSILWGLILYIGLLKVVKNKKRALRKRENVKEKVIKEK